MIGILCNFFKLPFDIFSSRTSGRESRIVLYRNRRLLRTLGLSDWQQYLNIPLEFLRHKYGISDEAIPASLMKPNKLVDRLKKKGYTGQKGTLKPKTDGNNKEACRFIFESDGLPYLLNRQSSKALSKEDWIIRSNIYVFSRDIGTDPQTTLPVIEPIVIFQDTLQPSIPLGKTRWAPVGISGLNKLLFPLQALEPKGFKIPHANTEVVPQTILIKGAPGAGKTTMAVQMMVAMAKKGIICKYWCSNDSENAIKDMASTYEFCSKEEIGKWSDVGPISIVPMDNEYLKYVCLEHDISKELQHTEVLFIDSLNVSQIENNDRQKLWNTFREFKKTDTLVFILLENYGQDGTEKARELIADCEFLADVVIELTEGEEMHFQTRYLKIAKKHYSRHIIGKHLYKISPPGHSLSNVSIEKGIIVYPSIHNYISSSREEMCDTSKESGLVHTGITHLDSILAGETFDHELDGKTIPPNSCFVISGPKGLHKLALGLNVLMGGLWKTLDNKTVVPHKDVLIIQLAEESDMNLHRIALARQTHEFTRRACPLVSLDNGNWVKWKKRENSRIECNKKVCDNYDMFNEANNRGQKIYFSKECIEFVKSTDDRGSNKESSGECYNKKVVVAGFRPGCITPEEFISSLASMMTDKKGNIIFSRVLFHSTAHMQSGFPLLSEEPLFIRTLTDFFKAKNIVSIFMDISGEGSNKTLSYGLGTMADYHLHVTPYTQEGAIRKLKFNSELSDGAKRIVEKCKKQERGLVWGELEVENIRGKEYSRSAHSITVFQQDKDTNDLIICDTGIPSAFSPLIELMWEKKEQPTQEKVSDANKVTRKIEEDIATARNQPFLPVDEEP